MCGAESRSTESEMSMAKMCPIEGCQQSKGFCIHEKRMMGTGALAMVAAVAHWGLNLF